MSSTLLNHLHGCKWMNLLIPESSWYPSKRSIRYQKAKPADNVCWNDYMNGSIPPKNGHRIKSRMYFVLQSRESSYSISVKLKSVGIPNVIRIQRHHQPHETHRNVTFFNGTHLVEIKKKYANHKLKEKEINKVLINVAFDAVKISQFIYDKMNTKSYLSYYQNFVQFMKGIDFFEQTNYKQEITPHTDQLILMHRTKIREFIGLPPSPPANIDMVIKLDIKYDDVEAKKKQHRRFFQCAFNKQRKWFKNKIKM